MIIEIDGISVEIIRKPIKSVNLRIYPPNGLVKLSAPMKYSERLIKKLLHEKSYWIRTQQKRVQEHGAQNNESLETGAIIPFKGSNYLLVLNEHHGPAQLQIHDALIHCHIHPNASQIQKEALLKRWYKREMELVLPELIHHWEKIINVHATKWTIKTMKTRWGSCNTRSGSISLNLNLIKKPLACLEYVLVHELVHLLEASHNHRFYTLMSQFLPQWQDCQVLLEGKRLRC